METHFQSQKMNYRVSVVIDRNSHFNIVTKISVVEV